MNILLETYGKTVVACVVGSIMLLFILSLKDTYYREVYPQHNESSIVTMYDLTEHNKSYPKLEVVKKAEGDIYGNKLTVKRNSPDYNLRKYKNSHLTDSTAKAEYQRILKNYQNLVVAYENEDSTTKIPVQVFGAEEVDVTDRGRQYEILFVAKNDLGLVTQKKMYILVD